MSSLTFALCVILDALVFLVLAGLFMAGWRWIRRNVPVLSKLDHCAKCGGDSWGFPSCPYCQRRAA